MPSQGKANPLSDAVPIIVGYFSISLAFGVIAKDVLGWNAVLMSAAVFAGASQFIALQMLSKGAAASLVIFTTFLVNLRHVLMSSYLSTFYRGVHWTKRVVVAFGITDETFAISSRRFGEGRADFVYNASLNFMCYASWVSGTAAGLLLPSAPQAVELLPFALTAFFICILVLSVESVHHIFVLVIAGVAAITLSSLPTGWNIIVATLLASFAGGVVERWRR